MITPIVTIYHLFCERFKISLSPSRRYSRAPWWPTLALLCNFGLVGVPRLAQVFASTLFVLFRVFWINRFEIHTLAFYIQGTAHMKSNQRRPCQHLPALPASASRILSLPLCGKGKKAKMHIIVLSSLFGNCKWNFDVPVLIICCAINHMWNCQQLHQLRSMEVAWERSTAVAIVELILLPDQLMGKLSSWMYLSLRVSLSLSLPGTGRQQSQ